MFSLSVPGVSSLGAAPPDALVIGSRLDVVDALLAAGIERVVLACSADAVRHALRGAKAGDHMMVVVDPSARGPVLSGLRERPDLLPSLTVFVRGAVLDVEDRRTLRQAFATVWCSADLPASALARVAMHRAAA